MKHRDMTPAKRTLLLICLMLLGIIIGNRIYNHVHAWLGLAVILVAIIYSVYMFIQILKDEENH